MVMNTFLPGLLLQEMYLLELCIICKFKGKDYICWTHHPAWLELWPRCNWEQQMSSAITCSENYHICLITTEMLQSGLCGEDGHRSIMDLLMCSFLKTKLLCKHLMSFSAHSTVQQRNASVQRWSHHPSASPLCPTCLKLSLWGKALNQAAVTLSGRSTALFISMRLPAWPLYDNGPSRNLQRIHTHVCCPRGCLWEWSCTQEKRTEKCSCTQVPLCVAWTFYLVVTAYFAGGCPMGLRVCLYVAASPNIRKWHHWLAEHKQNTC